MADELSKIDTQGMSGGPVGDGSNMLKSTKYPVDPITGETIYPSMSPVKMRILPKNEALYNELKELINEVLDEREARRYSNVSIGSTLNVDL